MTFLRDNGLPKSASPFLSFCAYSKIEIDERIKTFSVPVHIYPIGHNGSGDIIAIDLDNREVVYFNHDARNLRIFINSSLAKFAESVCVFQEHLTKKKMDICLKAIGLIDIRAIKNGSMWPDEIDAELSDS